METYFAIFSLAALALAAGILGAWAWGRVGKHRAAAKVQREAARETQRAARALSIRLRGARLLRSLRGQKLD